MMFGMFRHFTHQSLLSRRVIIFTPSFQVVADHKQRPTQDPKDGLQICLSTALLQLPTAD